MTIRVAVVDDQALVRRGFAMVLEHQPDIEVVAEAATVSKPSTLSANTDPTSS